MSEACRLWSQCTHSKHVAWSSMESITNQTKLAILTLEAFLHNNKKIPATKSPLHWDLNWRPTDFNMYLQYYFQWMAVLKQKVVLNLGNILGWPFTPYWSDADITYIMDIENNFLPFSGADSRFPGGAPTLQGASTYFRQIFQKLPPLDPPLILKVSITFNE